MTLLVKGLTTLNVKIVSKFAVPNLSLVGCTQSHGWRVYKGSSALYTVVRNKYHTYAVRTDLLTGVKHGKT